jgi:hypothetical protein
MLDDAAELDGVGHEQRPWSIAEPSRGSYLTIIVESESSRDYFGNILVSLFR